MIMYGTTDCEDTIDAKEVLEELGIAYEFRDLGVTVNLKEFLQLRDTLDIFDRVKEKGFIGIPCFVFGDEDNKIITRKLEDVKAQHGF